MKNKIKHLLFIVASAATLTSCFPDPEEEGLIYNGPSVVEFKNHTLGMVADSRVNRGGAQFGLDSRGILSTSGSTQTDSSRVISLIGGTVPGSTPATDPRIVKPRTVDTVYVQLVGPQRSTPSEVNFDVLTTSTAYEGVHYNLSPAGSRKVTIPANSSFGYILINPIPSAFTGTERRRLDLRLTGSSDLRPSVNYDTFYVTMTRTF